MKGLIEALRPLLEKLLSFFDVFDLSFFVSGGACVLAAFLLLDGAGWSVPAGLDGLTLAVTEPASRT